MHVLLYCLEEEEWEWQAWLCSHKTVWKKKNHQQGSKVSNSIYYSCVGLQPPPQPIFYSKFHILYKICTNLLKVGAE